MLYAPKGSIGKANWQAKAKKIAADNAALQVRRDTLRCEYCATVEHGEVRPPTSSAADVPRATRDSRGGASRPGEYTSGDSIATEKKVGGN